jgi:hypothetical protein
VCFSSIRFGTANGIFSFFGFKVSDQDKDKYQRRLADNGGVKGIVQPFELGGVTRLIRSAVKFCMAGN